MVRGRGIAFEQVRDVFRDHIEILLLFVKHVAFFVHPRFQRQGVDPVDHRQGIFSLHVFRFFGGHVSAGLVAHQLPFGIHGGLAGAVILY